MCGIVGYIGSKPAGDIIIDGLRRLEYRGYDSAGIAVLQDRAIELRRSVGKLSALVKALESNAVRGTVGIGHTRWATHGRPCEENAHPHTDCTGKIVVVHNGIIENYLELKKQLQQSGHVFKSETDTEVIAHLVEARFNGELRQAVQGALAQVRGAYALGVIAADEPGRIIVARRDAPLIIGLGEGENFLASDIPALLPYTRRMVFLEEGDLADIGVDKVVIYNGAGETVLRKEHSIAWDAVQAEKGGYKHFMLKEIFEQPQAIQDTFRGRISKIYIVACGTSYHAGLVGKFLFENLARIPVEVDIASEFRYRSPVLDKNAVAIVISQSGETADTLAALRLSKQGKCPVIAVCNAIGSTVSREADATLYTRCGPEIGVASTKAFTGQLTALYLLAFDWAGKRGTLTGDTLLRLIRELWEVPGKVSEALKSSDTMRSLAKEFSQARDFLYLGRNINYPVALEGALKLK